MSSRADIHPGKKIKVRIFSASDEMRRKPKPTEKRSVQLFVLVFEKFGVFFRRKRFRSHWASPLPLLLPLLLPLSLLRPTVGLAGKKCLHGWAAATFTFKEKIRLDVETKRPLVAIRGRFNEARLTCKVFFVGIHFLEYANDAIESQNQRDNKKLGNLVGVFCQVWVSWLVSRQVSCSGRSTAVERIRASWAKTVGSNPAGW